MVACPPELSDQKWAAIKRGCPGDLTGCREDGATQEVVKGLKILCDVRRTEDSASLGIFFCCAMRSPGRCEHFLY